MRYLFVAFLMSFNTYTNGQRLETNGGIKFENNLSWKQIIEKAKVEKKFIFVDVYATWCSPCKQMDKMVYTSKEVADYANDNFISVKVQLDTSKNDDSKVKSWYSIAHEFKEKFKVNELPTFLFFSPSGEIVDRASGFQYPDDFIRILSDATNYDRQVYTQLERYKRGEKNYKLLPQLAKKVDILLHDRSTAFVIAEDYNLNYFNKLKDDSLLNKENLEFIAWRPDVLTSKDRYFHIFLKRGLEIDSIKGQKGFAESISDWLISKEEIWNKITLNGRLIEGTPNWKQISTTIEKKYGKVLAERNILNAKINWFSLKKDRSNAIKYNVEKIEKYGVDTSFMGRFNTNNMIYELIFAYCDDLKILNKAIKWIEVILDAEHYKDGITIDTYANLLYKVGRTKEAIEWQEKATELSSDSDEVKEHLEKMKKQEPTWLTVKK